MGIKLQSTVIALVRAELEEGVAQVDVGSVQLADNEVVSPLSISLSPCVRQMAHNRLVIRGRGLCLCTHAPLCVLKVVGGEPIKEDSKV